MQRSIMCTLGKGVDAGCIEAGNGVNAVWLDAPARTRANDRQAVPGHPSTAGKDQQ